MCDETGNVIGTPLPLNPSYVSGTDADLFINGDDECPFGYFISHLLYYYNYAPYQATCSNSLAC